eukprot:3875996-Lingulodinium_polyedra.AAC.1
MPELRPEALVARAPPLPPPADPPGPGGPGVGAGAAGPAAGALGPAPPNDLDVTALPKEIQSIKT